MNADERTHGQSGCGADAGAYVLGALTSEEAEAFRSHLSTCIVCRDEVAALEAVAGALALAAPQLPAPRRLRRRVLADVRREPAPRAALVGRPRLRARPPRGAAALGGALALAGAIVAAIVLASGGSAGTRVVRASVALPRGSAVVRLAGGHAELVLRGMPQAPPGEIYEVWLQRAGHSPSPTSALFDVTSAGAGAVDVPGDLRGVRELLVTPEPRGGSLSPTHAPVIVAQLA
jgi:hypothetical protein